MERRGFIRRIVASDRAVKFSLFVQLRPKAGSDVGEVRKTIHSTDEISPDRLDLGDAEEKGMHETEDVYIGWRERYEAEEVGEEGVV